MRCRELNDQSVSESNTHRRSRAHSRAQTQTTKKIGENKVICAPPPQLRRSRVRKTEAGKGYAYARHSQGHYIEGDVKDRGEFKLNFPTTSSSDGCQRADVRQVSGAKLYHLCGSRPMGSQYGIVGKSVQYMPQSLQRTTSKHPRGV